MVHPLADEPPESKDQRQTGLATPFQGVLPVVFRRECLAAASASWAAKGPSAPKLSFVESVTETQAIGRNDLLRFA